MKDSFQAKQGQEVPSGSNLVNLSSEGCHYIELKISQIWTIRELPIIYISSLISAGFLFLLL